LAEGIARQTPLAVRLETAARNPSLEDNRSGGVCAVEFAPPSLRLAPPRRTLPPPHVFPTTMVACCAPALAEDVYGLPVSAMVSKQSKAIDREIKEDERRLTKEVKMLLLGELAQTLQEPPAKKTN
jgi:hypothetical protein